MRTTLSASRPVRSRMLTIIAGLAAAGAMAVSTTAMSQSRGPSVAETQEARERVQRDREQQRRAAIEDATLRGQRVAILVGEGLHDMETLAPLAYLANRGARVTVIGIEPGLVNAYNSDISVRVERAVSDVNINQFDALVLPGGRGPAVLRENSDAVAFARDFFESGRPVAAICHGPQVLVTAGVLRGRTATCIASISSELQEAGAEYRDEAVVKDGNLITSRLPDDIPAFLNAIEEAMIDARAQRGPEGRPGRRGDGDRGREGRPGAGRGGEGGRGGAGRGGEGGRGGRGR